jgi:exonuclease III
MDPTKILVWNIKGLNSSARQDAVRTMVESSKADILCLQETKMAAVLGTELSLIEREDDTRSWENFLVYFSHSTIMPCPPRSWEYILIGC